MARKIDRLGSEAAHRADRGASTPLDAAPDYSDTLRGTDGGRRRDSRGCSRARGNRYRELLGDVACRELASKSENRRHTRHVSSIRLDLDVWKMDRNAFVNGLRERGIACSVNCLPFHIQLYCRATNNLLHQQFPTASALWPSFRA